jgi:predicted DNA-binding protein (MmcQ/YjbR family)
MNIEDFRDFCLSLPYTTEGFPFDSTTLVFKVKGKMFAITDVTTFESINVKCDPDLAIELRERYDAVQPGWHMNKALWNTVLQDGSINDKTMKEFIVHSFKEVVKKMPKKDRFELDI